MKNIIILSLCLFVSIITWAQKPMSHPNMEWEYISSYSDEFNEDALNEQKWDIDVKDWGTWSWEPENTCIKDTVLSITMQQKEHSRGGKEYYFTSGIAQIKEKMTYGYFETKIKAAAKGQGTCPAFWLYSVGEPIPTEEGGVQYSEIDVIELFQVVNKTKRLEMNLHTRIMENGELTWKRPGQGNTELCHNSWDAPWDPRDEYHTYGVLNRVDSIFWYVDGVQRGAKENKYWHLPMNVTVSMGLRNPYEKYINGVRTIMPFPENVPEPGFPAEMYCDYVRVWEAKPQIIVDTQLYKTTTFLKDEDLIFECYYDAGTGHKVIDNKWDGLTVQFVEKNEDDNIVNSLVKVVTETTGTPAGNIKVRIPLIGLSKTSDLPNGHYYEIIPVFRSSENESKDIFVLDPIKNIQIVGEATGINNPKTDDNNVLIFPNPTTKTITIEHKNASIIRIQLYDLSGSLIRDKRFENSALAQLAVDDLANGIYFAKIQTPSATITKKFMKQ